MNFSSLYKKPNRFFSFLTLSILLIFSSNIVAQETIKQTNNYNQYSGVVLDADTFEPLVFASLTIVGSNISTITNSEGVFALKVPLELQNGKIEITMLGYKKKLLSIDELKTKKSKILLQVSIVKLSEVVIDLPKDAKQLVQDMFIKVKDNYSKQNVLMTAFYRESIKKRTKSVSLAEAIVTVYKQPYSNSFRDKIKLYKARKSTDYTKMDTIALKLEGGPFNALFVDIMKYPEYVFTPVSIDNYHFSFSPSTTINNKSVYVVNFKQKLAKERPLYFGKLYIDVKTKALISAIYSLNVEDKEKASKLFVKKKPKDIFVYPTSVSYRVDYREKDGKWYYGYSNAQLTFKIKKKGKWFKSTYSINSEMLVTDWKENINKEKPKYKDRMRYSIIISDEASGFSDPAYWGEFNVIEPDKSIENAIKKIKKKLIE